MEAWGQTRKRNAISAAVTFAVATLNAVTCRGVQLSEDVDSDTPRTAREIARRSIALHCAIAAAHGVSKDDITEWLKEEQLWNEVTPREMTFISEDLNDDKEIVWMTWLVEAQVALLWSIGKLDELPPASAKCDTGIVVGAMPGLFEPTAPFIASATLRSAKDIEREEEIIYDVHCRVDQAVRKGKRIPRGYDKDVVFFRHYGLSWVSGYCGQSWDEVTPDT